MRKTTTAAALAASLAACATTPQGLPPVAVTAVAETEPVGTAHEDAADDPAIWRNASDPEKSLIVATDKKGGLYVHAIDGRTLHFRAQRGLNNVDLVEYASGEVIVFASDRSDRANARIALFRLDTSTARLEPVASLPSGGGEAYGICGYVRGGHLIVYTAPKEGNIGEWQISLEPVPSARLLRSMEVPSQPEGCVVDGRSGDLYIGEEAAGIWRFRAGETSGEIVARVDGRMLVADLEGLAILPEGETGGYLVASSQGDNAYGVYSLPGFDPLGRFEIAQGSFGAAEETDGIALDGRSFGPDFPQGLFIAQDGDNGTMAQNFKLVSWRDILKALEN